jgi:hypothetical protein
MSITVACPACKAKFAAPEEAAGRTAHCPKCNSPIPVPAPPRPLATEKQKDYARELGIEFPANIDRKTISKLIDEAVAKRDKERFDRLDDLERREAVAAEGLRLADATTDEMVKALTDRGMIAILISRDDIEDFDHMEGIPVILASTDDMTQHDMESVIFAVAAPIVYKRMKES